MTFLETLRARAAARRRCIIFPETRDARTIDAIRELRRSRIVEPVVVLDSGAPASRAAVGNLGVEIVDPECDPRREQVAAHLLARRSAKGLTREEAERMAATPLFFATGLVALREVDGCVAGAVHTTAEVLRAALCTIGAWPGIGTVSGTFYMALPPFRGGSEREEVLTFTDCAVVPNPSAEQLADIAAAASLDRMRIVGDVPRVAFLSYSTRGSAAGESVERVRAAVAMLREREPALAVDGELQADAALIPAIAGRKAPASGVAGHANVLVFPSLDAGNIAYKLVERLAHACAIGPILQGLARPCSDLSRGASVDDIINVAAITALRAEGTTADGGRIPTGEVS